MRPYGDSELGVLGKLTEMQAYQTSSLSGVIPSELGNAAADASRTMRIRLDRSEISGTLPTQLATLTGFFQLIAYEASPSGTLPSQVGPHSLPPNLWCRFELYEPYIRSTPQP